ncbi:endothelin-converting enzyme [Candidatus Koribacter versatilis Ellin345]|uniref:Endothelin-converting enzyme n=1 Tax=Koribacter versatilis (strain Ellin345) TaxID=204669 RepID=Q1IHY4_KORVE|nr:M13 family metallopeptidase [Candidatus Koribacter versatilis]ABF43516.1 endothelin-converting enzyme [Candidatus Koribacter versatilis Ellin345]
MQIPKIVGIFLLCGAAAFAQTSTDSAKPPAPEKILSFDVEAIDTSVNPCENFYQFACGNWKKTNPIPGDQTRWGQFNKLAENNRLVLYELLTSAAKPGKHNPIEQKVGDYFAACMDTKTIEARGAEPLKAQLDAISKISNRTQLMEAVANLQQNGVRTLMAFYASADMHDATTQVANIDQGGITLPDRDNYLKDDAANVEMRAKYLEHVQKMFELLGDSSDTAKKEAQTVMTIETALAKASMDRTLRRDPKNRDHMTEVSVAEKDAANLELAKFFATTKAPEFSKVNVGNPDFFKQINDLVAGTPVDDMKVYLRWKALHDGASALSDKFVNEDFNFFNAYLRGQKEIAPRWKRCVEYTDGSLGEALGQLYVEKVFGKEQKERTQKMVKAIEEAMNDDLKSLEWMTPETKKAAYTKLESIVNNIGYPEKWRDYSSVKVTRDDFFGNSQRADYFEVHRNWNKIGKPTDKKEWGMTPPTVNAYYNPSRNDINFPAGILQSPFYAGGADDAVNLGGIGVVIGHELTHGFDDQGRKFDAQGNLRDWWTAEDGKAFEERAKCVSDEYSSFVSVKDDKGEVHLNGKLTLGENTADNGGLRLAYAALMKLINNDDSKKVDGYTPSQRFFISFAQVWCQNVTPQQARQLALVDPHSPGEWRANGTVRNFEGFYKAFGCKEGQPMVPTQGCRVW